MPVVTRGVDGAMEEGALVRRARSGDRAAFGLLIGRHADRVLRVALRVLGNREDAEDAVQTAMVKAVERIPGFREESSFATWFMAIVVRTCIDRDRRRQAEPRTVSLEADEPLADAGSPRALRVLQGREGLAAVQRELARLPVRIRSALVLRAIDGMSYPELCDTLGITRRTARTYVFEARQRLSHCLGPLLDEPEDDR